MIRSPLFQHSCVRLFTLVAQNKHNYPKTNYISAFISPNDAKTVCGQQIFHSASQSLLYTGEECLSCAVLKLHLNILEIQCKFLTNPVFSHEKKIGKQ